MAVISYTTERTTPNRIVVTWSSVTESDTAQTFELRELPQDISVHVSGTFGSSTTVLKVANDGGSGLDATDLGGTAVALTAEGITSLRERPLTIKPTMSGGTSQSLDVNMVVWL
ncbi:MAG: hypothetical protein JKY50_00045 [Oleispira sp.]|nr:hypothetical protein [Oleispira sp.]